MAEQRIRALLNANYTDADEKMDIYGLFHALNPKTYPLNRTEEPLIAEQSVAMARISYITKILNASSNPAREEAISNYILSLVPNSASSEMSMQGDILDERTKKIISALFNQTITFIERDEKPIACTYAAQLDPSAAVNLNGQVTHGDVTIVCRHLAEMLLHIKEGLITLQVPWQQAFATTGGILNAFIACQQLSPKVKVSYLDRKTIGNLLPMTSENFGRAIKQIIECFDPIDSFDEQHLYFNTNNHALLISVQYDPSLDKISIRVFDPNTTNFEQETCIQLSNLHKLSFLDLIAESFHKPYRLDCSPIYMSLRPYMNLQCTLDLLGDTTDEIIRNIGLDMSFLIIYNSALFEELLGKIETHGQKHEFIIKCCIASHGCPSALALHQGLCEIFASWTLDSAVKKKIITAFTHRAPRLDMIGNCTSARHPSPFNTHPINLLPILSLADNDERKIKIIVECLKSSKNTKFEPNGYSSLYLAAYNKQYKVIRLFMAALARLFSNGHISNKELVIILIRADTLSMDQRNGYPALFWALENLHYKVTEEYMEQSKQLFEEHPFPRDLDLLQRASLQLVELQQEASKMEASERESQASKMEAARTQLDLTSFKHPVFFGPKDRKLNMAIEMIPIHSNSSGD